MILFYRILLLVLSFSTLHLNISYAQKNLSKIIDELNFTRTLTDPIDFELEDLDGMHGKLSDYKGRWIWINFWATWCAPCRVEMPTLESLHREFKDQGLTILGISVDQGDVGKIKKYLAKERITFPILHDKIGSVSRLYKASSIPSIYLISPDWKIVGIFRGGKSWEDFSTISLIKELLIHRNVSSTFQVNKGGERGGIDLPNELLPPKIQFHAFKDKTFYVDEVYTFEVSILWPQNSRDYLIKVPAFEVENDLVKILKISSGARDAQTLNYRYQIKMLEEGSLHIGPLTLSYRPKKGGKELFIRDQGIDIVVHKKEYLFIGISIFLSILLVVGLLVIILKKKRSSKEVKVILDRVQLQDQYNKIKRLRVEGERIQYTKSLLNLHKSLSAENHFAKIDCLDNLLERVDYSSMMIPQDKLKIYENDIKSLLKNKDKEI